MAYLLIVDDDPEFSAAIAAVCQAKVTRCGFSTRPTWRCQHGRAPPRCGPARCHVSRDPSAGFQLARDIRRQHSELPILMLTAVIPPVSPWVQQQGH